MSDKYDDYFGNDDNIHRRVNYDDVDLFDLSKRRKQIDMIHQHIDEMYDSPDVSDSATYDEPQTIVESDYQYSQEYYDDDEFCYEQQVNLKHNTFKRKEFNFSKGNFAKYVLIAAILCVIISMILVHNAIGKVNYVDIDTHWSDMPSDDAPNWPLRNELNVTNILLLGIDGDGGDKQRSDTIMLLTLDDGNNAIKLTSILRDTYIAIPGRANKTRINHAYSYGGAALTMRTIESNFRIDIDRYIGVDMDGLTVVVDKIGGVDITLSQAEAKTINSHVKGSSLTKGKQHLNGAQATYYARIRKIDSDFGRTGRQRKLIKAMLAQIKNLDITEQYALVSEVAPYLTTNYNEAELIALALKALGLIESDVEEMSVPVKGMYQSKTISGMAVLVPDIPKNAQEMHKFIFGNLPE